MLEQVETISERLLSYTQGTLAPRAQVHDHTSFTRWQSFLIIDKMA